MASVVLSELVKDLVTLSVVYFYLKYMRRNLNDPGFLPDLSGIDPGDPFAPLKAFFRAQEQAGRDISGDAATAISQILINHPARNVAYRSFTDERITITCSALEDVFEEQRSSDVCEGSDIYSIEDPLEFAIYAAYEAMLLSGIAGYGDILRPRFIKESSSWKQACSIISEILKERFPQGGVISGFLECPKVL